MPFVNDRQLAKLQGYVDKTKDRALKARKKAEEKADEMIGTMECVGAAGAMGFLRGKFEKPNGEFNIPGTGIDIEMAVGLAGTAAVFFDLFGKYDDHVLQASNGILAHYTGQIARKFARTKQFTLVAGDHDPLAALDVGNDNWSNTSFNPTQIAAPYDDPVASALAESGV